MSIVAGSVFITRQEVRALRDRVASDTGAAIVAEVSIALPARRSVELGLSIPAPHEHRYIEAICSQTGAAAVYRRDHPHEHRTETGTLLTGPAADRGWNTWMHNCNANDARTCALAWALLDDARAADHARAILMKYADQYLNYPPLGRLVASWGRVQSSALEESIWGLSLLWAADVLHQSGKLSETDLATLKLRLFEPMIDLLWGDWYCIHNIRMWINAYIGSAGLFFGDRAATRHAIFGDKGYRQQLIDGFRGDGLHVEGSPGYHAYGATAMLMLAEAMERHDLAPYRESYLRKAMLVPFAIVQPDGTLPPLNDYWQGAQPPSRVAATMLARYDDPQVRSIAAVAFERWWSSGAGADATGAVSNRTPAYFGRSQVDWLLAWDRLGSTVTSLQRDTTLARGDWPGLRESTVELRESGVGIVRHKPDHMVLLKASKRGSGHDHHDKLGLIYWSAGTRWLSDKGSGSYTSAMHESWFKHTLSHNTVLVDGTKHERTDANLDACTLDQLGGRARPYPENMPDVRMQRRVAISDDSTLNDTFTIRCQQPRTIEYLLHPGGVLVEHPQVCATTNANFSDEPAYAHLESVRQIELDQACSHDGAGSARSEKTLRWQSGSRQFEVVLVSLPEGAQLFLAETPSNTMDRAARATSMLIRCISADATFVVRMRCGTSASATRVGGGLEAVG
jgi:oligo-alginate lyase